MNQYVVILPRRPISANRSTRNSKFATEIQTAAGEEIGGSQQLQGELYARIIWFHAIRRSQDVDNIAKRILDALSGVLYEDDRFVRQCLTETIHTQQDYTISSSNIDITHYDTLLTMLDDSEHTLYIEIGEKTEQHAVFGLIDGGEK